MRSQSRSSQLADDDAITLEEACELFFRGTISPSTLRAEARRGRLAVMRIGRRDFTTPAAIREMKEACRVQPKELGSISSLSVETRKALSSTPPHGSFATDPLSAAQAAVLATAKRLK